LKPLPPDPEPWGWLWAYLLAALAGVTVWFMVRF
jgi:hypothetical protein